MDILLLLQPKDEEKAQSTASASVPSRSASVRTTAAASTRVGSTLQSAAVVIPVKREQELHPSELPVKKEQDFHPSELPVKKEQELHPSELPVKKEQDFHPSELPVKREQEFHPSELPAKRQQEFHPSKLPAKRQQQIHPSGLPAKKRKWSREEDEKIIRLRGEGVTWGDIRKQLPGRNITGCRLRYQNYLERRYEWDEDRKDKLARLYERLKHQMWAPIAEEMSIPWRAIEAMHWQLGEEEVARRAAVTLFSLASTSNTTTPTSHPRSSSPAPRVQRASDPRPFRPYTPRLPSVGGLTAALPAYAGNLLSYHHHQLNSDYQPPGGPRR